MNNNTKAPVQVQVQAPVPAPVPGQTPKQSWSDWVKSKMPSFNSKKTGGKRKPFRNNRKNGGYRYTSTSKSQSKPNTRPKKTRKTSSR